VQLGREAMATDRLPVYAAPRLAAMLGGNLPWSDLLSYGHVDLRPLSAGAALPLGGRVTVTPLAVPHRDEHSETLAFQIAGPSQTVLYLPDIDAWDDWGTPLDEALRGVDAAYLDGTFFDAGELAGRDQRLVPHPPIAETLRRLADLPARERAKVRFTHLNHTNPALVPGGEARRAIEALGCRLAEEMERVVL
jgi:pyrroloquinoline quinone biosynthesis protein B